MNKNQPKNAYQGGAEDFKGFIRLSSNENNYGPPKNVLSTIKENTKNSNRKYEQRKQNVATTQTQR